MLSFSLRRRGEWRNRFKCLRLRPNVKKKQKWKISEDQDWSQGFDRIPNEFIKNAPDRLFSILSILFNKMKDDNVFPGWLEQRSDNPDTQAWAACPLVQLQADHSFDLFGWSVLQSSQR